MALGDIFKSEAQREKEKRMERRKALRGVERAVNKIRDRIVSLKNERDATWREARGYLKSGQKEAAQRCLQTYRASEVLMDLYEKKYWVSRQLVTKMESAGIDQEIAGAFRVLQKVIEIDPEKISEILDDVRDALEEQGDTEKMWEGMYEADMAGIERVSDKIPSVDDMMKNLEDEVLAEVGEHKIAEGEKQSDSIFEEIEKGRLRRRKLMEDDK